VVQLRGQEACHAEFRCEQAYSQFGTACGNSKCHRQGNPKVVRLTLAVKMTGGGGEAAFHGRSVLTQGFDPGASLSPFQLRKITKKEGATACCV